MIQTAATSTREYKPAGDLTGDDWVFADAWAPGEPLWQRVHTVLPWRGNPTCAEVMVVGDQGRPVPYGTFNACDTVQVATAADLSAMRDKDRRAMLAAQLADVGNLLQDPAVPIPNEFWPIDIRIEVPAAAVRAVADRFGLDVTENNFDLAARWPAGPPSYEPATVQTFWVYVKSEEERLQPRDFCRIGVEQDPGRDIEVDDTVVLHAVPAVEHDGHPLGRAGGRPS